MKTEIPCLDLEYMELDEEDRLTEQDALMLGVVREESYGPTEERQRPGI